MSYKNKILLVFFFTLPVFNPIHIVTHQNPEIMLTLEEVEELIEQMNENGLFNTALPYIDKSYEKLTLNPNIHSKKGLEKIINCINNKPYCNFDDLIPKVAFSPLGSDYLLDVDEDLYQNLEPLPNISDYKNELEYWCVLMQYQNDIEPRIEDLEFQIRAFFTHLLFYLEGKKMALR